MQGNGRESKSKGSKCANCHAELPKDALYCDACGTKKSDGKFKPRINKPRVIYGPPVRINQYCFSCGYVLQNYGIRSCIRKSSKCPKCGASLKKRLDISEKNRLIQKISEAEVEKLLDLREYYNEFDQRRDVYGADYLSKFMKKNGFPEFKKSEDGESLSNYETERMNLVKMIMSTFGLKNAMPLRLVCPKCEGHFACQIKKLKRKEGSNKEIIPRNKIVLAISSSCIRVTKGETLMCLQCGNLF